MKPSPKLKLYIWDSLLGDMYAGSGFACALAHTVKEAKQAILDESDYSDAGRKELRKELDSYKPEVIRLERKTPTAWISYGG